ncbi:MULTISPECIES: nickel pincer cofactor biosynthesis protein LarB [Sodalis]|jgi:NCAIR mutase (PurE)-related protein|uniref:PurE domain-containing protein n=1 Tax=Sodalis ligni TaxID=2697027 RepID=A0A4R1NAJ0_9GAMM|nr:nickel pincer cofactor biosynthesis protein LarB [Sodalis ligni]TCL04323.1 hypothetical protein EZJ58_2436 [Sodalis ligni]
MNTFEDLGYCKVDVQRESRTGFPEVIFGQGKTVAQIAGIFDRLLSHHGKAMVTRLGPGKAAQVMAAFPEARYDAGARILCQGGAKARFAGEVMVLCAGTSDLPVAEEAALTAEWMGCRVRRRYDVGVAGIDRLLAYRDEIARASVLIVVAGMEGALPSVVGGLTGSPVIAVPTSVGYGAHFQGVTPLLTMLTSCAAGVSVVNIDNGFGAAYQAAQIMRLVNEGAPHAAALS